MIVEYGAIVKVDFRRLGLSQRKSEFFNRIGKSRPLKIIPDSSRSKFPYIEISGSVSNVRFMATC